MELILWHHVDSNDVTGLFTVIMIKVGKIYLLKMEYGRVDYYITSLYIFYEICIWSTADALYLPVHFMTSSETATWSWIFPLRYFFPQDQTCTITSETLLLPTTTNNIKKTSNFSCCRKNLLRHHFRSFSRFRGSIFRIARYHSTLNGAVWEIPNLPHKKNFLNCIYFTRFPGNLRDRRTR